jgi:hypothetical protein
LANLTAVLLRNNLKGYLARPETGELRGAGDSLKSAFDLGFNLFQRERKINTTLQRACGFLRGLLNYVSLKEGASITYRTALFLSLPLIVPVSTTAILLIQSWVACDGFRDAHNHSFEAIWCERRDSNPHALRRWNLNPVRLPIPPPSHFMELSGNT